MGKEIKTLGDIEIEFYRYKSPISLKDVDIESALILKKNVIANLSTIKKFWKTKIKCYGDEDTDFYDKAIPKVGSNHTC